MKNAILFLALCAIGGLVSISWNKECKHIYVAVEPAKVEYPCYITPHPMIPQDMDWAEPEVGSHNSDHDVNNNADGISLVCVKCYHETKQKIHFTHKR